VIVKLILRRFLFTVLLIATGVSAQEYDEEQLLEIERQQAFRDGVAAIVEDINNDSLSLFTASIDNQALLERIMGLRLIDRRIQKSFSESFDQTVPNLVKAMLRGRAETNFKAHVLSVASRGTQGRALIRYDLPDFQFNYHEYDLKLDDKGNVRIVDWVDFLRGESFADEMGTSLVSAAPSKAAVRKLISQRLNESQIFQVTELLKSARDRNINRFLEIFNGMNDNLKSERVVVLVHAQFMRDMRRKRQLRTALDEMAKHYPQEPLFSLMLLDVYFPTRKFEEAREALLRLESRLGVEDSAMKARLSAAELVLGNLPDSLRYANQSVELEPGLELGWWSVMRVAALDGAFERSVEALTVLEDQFGHALNPEALSKDPMLGDLLRSDVFQEWSAARHGDG